ncbi:MAG: hypothetical protein H6704_08265 [Myxococcales bacterium]|nr:hypothetical protein [Myxococcales bacterium]
MDFGSFLQQVCSYQGWAWTHAQGGYRVEVPTEHGRSQVVQITQGHDPDGRYLAYIWSVVCEASYIGDPYYLLRLNADLPYGALALRDPHVILVETQLMQTADPEEVMRSVFYVAKYADDLEKQVHGHVDRN